MATYTIKSKVVSVGRDYDVRDEKDEIVFKIDGKVRFARTFDVIDQAGNVVCSAKEKLATLDQTFVINGPRGEITVKRTTTGSVYPMKFDIMAGEQTTMTAHGDFFRDGVNVTRGSDRVLNVNRVQNTAFFEIFPVSIAEGEDVAFMLALAMVIVEGDHSRGSKNQP
jgi:uncharacterized protein YxjI